MPKKKQEQFDKSMKQTVLGNCSSQIKIKEIDMMYLMIKYILLTRSKLKKKLYSIHREDMSMQISTVKAAACRNI